MSRGGEKKREWEKKGYGSKVQKNGRVKTCRMG